MSDKTTTELSADEDRILQCRRDFTARMAAEEKAYGALLIHTGCLMFERVCHDPKMRARIAGAAQLPDMVFDELARPSAVLGKIADAMHQERLLSPVKIDMPTPVWAPQDVQRRSDTWAKLLEDAVDHMPAKTQEIVMQGFLAFGGFLMLLQQIPPDEAARYFKDTEEPMRSHQLAAIATLMKLGFSLREKCVG